MRTLGERRGTLSRGEKVRSLGAYARVSGDSFLSCSIVWDANYTFLEESQAIRARTSKLCLYQSRISCMEFLRLRPKAASSILRMPISRPSVHSLFSRTQPTFRTRPSSNISFRGFHSQTPRRPTLRNSPTLNLRKQRRWKSDDVLDSKPESELTLSQRMKKLSREYGWAAFGVYMALTALDLPFCYLAVVSIGPETVGHWEHVIVGYIKGFLQWPLAGTAHEQVGEAIDKIGEATGANDGKRLLEEAPAGSQYEVEDHGYKEAAAANRGEGASKMFQSCFVSVTNVNSGIWTTLALAYALHKSFIFIRIPLAASITPKVVKTLRGWGWNIGRPTIKSLRSSKSKSTTGVNTKGSGVKPDD